MRTACRCVRCSARDPHVVDVHAREVARRVTAEPNAQSHERHTATSTFPLRTLRARDGRLVVAFAVTEHSSPNLDTASPSLRARLREWLDPSIDPALRERFTAELADANARRLRVLIPLMLVAHVIHAAVFATFGARRHALSERVLVWRDGIAVTHALTFALAAALLVSLHRARTTRGRALVAPMTGLLYLAHAAVIVSIDQLTLTGVTPFVGYALGIAVAIVIAPLVSLAMYAIALATFVVGIEVMQPSASVGLATLPNGFSIVAVSMR